MCVDAMKDGGGFGSMYINVSGDAWCCVLLYVASIGLERGVCLYDKAFAVVRWFTVGFSPLTRPWNFLEYVYPKCKVLLWQYILFDQMFSTNLNILVVFFFIFLFCILHKSFFNIYPVSLPNQYNKKVSFTIFVANTFFLLAITLFFMQ